MKELVYLDQPDGMRRKEMERNERKGDEERGKKKTMQNNISKSE